MKNDKTTALGVVSDLDVDVYLGGSRRMAQKYGFSIDPDTDYDFYATYSSVIAYELIKNGFVDTAVESNTEYDLDTEAVQIFYRDNVQIVLRKDAVFYESVFENIPKEVYVNYLWKSAPHLKHMDERYIKIHRALIGRMFDTFFAMGHLGTRSAYTCDYI